MSRPTYAIIQMQPADAMVWMHVVQDHGSAVTSLDGSLCLIAWETPERHDCCPVPVFEVGIHGTEEELRALTSGPAWVDPSTLEDLIV